MTDSRTTPVSAARRRAVIDALRRGAVPESGLDLLATGLDRFEAALDAELDAVASGASVFKAVRGEYGSGKTFFTRWLGERAKRRNFATAEIQVSETETPLHKLETVYRRLTERLTTGGFPPSALRPVVDAWFYALEEDALAAARVFTAWATGFLHMELAGAFRLGGDVDEAFRYGLEHLLAGLVAPPR